MKKVYICILLTAAALLSAVCPAMAAEEPLPDPEQTAEASALPGSDEPEEETALEESEALPVLDGTYVDEEKKIAARILSDDMSDYEKLYTITKYAADNFDYSSASSGSSAERIINTGAGNCYANSYFIIDLCTIAGIPAWLRSAGRDKNASSTHVDVIAIIDGQYYTAGAGSGGTKPRYFGVSELPGGFSVEDGVMYQYDGVGVTDLVVPAKSADAFYQNRNGTKTIRGMTITQIGYAGEECFSYGGSSGLRSITLPSTVKTVTATAFKGCKDLENIYVDADNPYFTSIDGVLYSKDLTRLVCVPAKKTSIMMPDTVTTQDKDAFYGGKIPVTEYSGSLPFEDVSDEWFAGSVRFVYKRSLFMGTSTTRFSPNAAMTRGMFVTVLGRFAGNGKWSALDEWSGTLGVSGANQIAVRDKTTTSGSTVLTRIASSGELVQVLSTVEEGEDGAVWYQVRYGSTTGYVRQKSTAASGTTLLHVYTGKFEDLPDQAYYTGYAQWASIFHIAYGVTDTAYGPKQDIRRQDICVLLYRYLKDYLGYDLAAGSGKAFSDDADIADYARDAVYAMQQIGVISGYPDGTFRPNANATRAEVATMFQSLYGYVNK